MTSLLCRFQSSPSVFAWFFLNDWRSAHLYPLGQDCNLFLISEIFWKTFPAFLCLIPSSVLLQVLLLVSTNHCLKVFLRFLSFLALTSFFFLDISTVCSDIQFAIFCFLVTFHVNPQLLWFHSIALLAPYQWGSELQMIPDVLLKNRAVFSRLYHETLFALFVSLSWHLHKSSLLYLLDNQSLAISWLLYLSFSISLYQ